MSPRPGAAGRGEEEAPPLVSVVLPIRNERDHLHRCLDAILSQDYPEDRMEILVADGMSDDGTRNLLEQIRERDGRIHVVDNPGRIVPTGLNAAIREAQGRVIVRVDGHTIIEPHYVTEAIRALQRTGADVVGGKMTARGRGPFGRSVALATSNPMGVGGSRFHYASTEEPAESAYMGTFRRDVFDRFGFFDEGLVRNQDDEFNYRVRKAGGSVYLVPSMRSVYTPRESAGRLFKQYFQYGYFKIRVARLHPGMMRARHLAPSAFFLLLLLLVTAAPFTAAASLALAALLAVHASASLAFSREAARRDPVPWLLTPVVTLILHVAYGSGFLAGALAALAGRMPGVAPPGPGEAEGRKAAP